MHIEHIAMYVKDLEKAKAFFTRYFSAAANERYHNKATDFRSYFLSFDGGARLEIMTRPHLTAEEYSAYRTGYSHIAFSLRSRAAVEALTERQNRVCPCQSTLSTAIKWKSPNKPHPFHRGGSLPCRK